MSNMASYRTFSSRMGGGPDHSPARFAGAALSLLGLGPLSPQPAPEVLSLADPSGVRAVSPRPAAAPSRPTSRIRPEGPTRGSGVSSPPGPTMPASPGCRRYRWTSPNTSRPWWGSRSFHGAAGGARSIPTGYVRQSEHHCAKRCANRTIFSVQRPFPVCESSCPGPPGCRDLVPIRRNQDKALTLLMTPLRACPKPLL